MANRPDTDERRATLPQPAHRRHALGRLPRVLAVPALAGLVVLSLLGGRFAKGSVPPPAAPSYSALLEDQVGPAFGTLAGETAALRRSVIRYCAHPSDVSREAAMRAMERAVRALGAVTAVGFGPATEDREIARMGGSGPQPGTVDAVESVVQGRAPLPASPTALHAMALSLQGLPALEAAIYRPLREDSPVGKRQCHLARTIAAHLAWIAADAHADWSDSDRHPDLSAALSDGARGDRLDTLREEMLSGAVAAVDGLVRELGAREADGPEDAPGQTFRSAPLHVAFLEGTAGGLAALFASPSFARVMGEEGRPALEAVQHHVRRALRAVGRVDPEDGISGREERLLETGHVHAAEIELAMLRVVPAAGRFRR